MPGQSNNHPPRPAHEVAIVSGGPAAAMTMRENYAGQAMAAIISSNPAANSPGATARDAYEYADALIQFGQFGRVVP